LKDKLGKRLSGWRVKIVLPHISGKYLDIGCGTNDVVKAYSGEGMGVDVYPWEGVDKVVENTAKLSFDDKTFDTVSIIAALNHIPNRNDVLREVRRVLKDDGKLITTMIPPNFSKRWHLLRRPWDADQHERGMKDGEVYGISSSEMKTMLSDAGFDIVLRKKFMFGINELLISKKNKN